MTSATSQVRLYGVAVRRVANRWREGFGAMGHTRIDEDYFTAGSGDYLGTVHFKVVKGRIVKAWTVRPTTHEAWGRIEREDVAFLLETCPTFTPDRRDLSLSTPKEG